MKKPEYIIFVGVRKPFKYDSKSKVLRRVYKRAKKNPFISTMNYEEYKKFLADGVERLNGASDVEWEHDAKLYDTLKEHKWIKEIFGMIIVFLL